MMQKFKAKIGRVARKIADRLDPPIDCTSPSCALGTPPLPTFVRKPQRILARHVYCLGDSTADIDRYLMHDIMKALYSSNLVKFSAHIDHYDPTFIAREAEVMVLEPTEEPWNTSL